MTNTTKARRGLTIALAALFAAPVLPALAGVGSTAEAGGIHVRVGGSVRVHVGTPVRVRTRRWRPRVYQPRRVYVHGGFYSYRFAAPPPPRVYCDAPAAAYDCGPTPAPAPIVAQTVVHREPLPRLGLGVTAGRFESEDGLAADDFGVFGRLRLSNALELELETAKTTHDDGARLDKRLGAALYLDFSPYSTWAPYAVGGLGMATTDVGGTFESDRHYAEIGGGLRWRLSDRLTVAGDLRVGQSVAQQDEDVIALAVVPPVDDEEAYTRFSLKGILYF